MGAGRLPSKLHPKVLRRKVFGGHALDFGEAGVRGELHGDGSGSVLDATHSFARLVRV